MKLISSFLFVLVSFISMSQNSSILEDQEITLDSLLSELRSAENDADKATKNAAFKEEMRFALQSKEALTYNFTKLKTVGIIDSPDKKVRIINWNVELDDFSHQYHSFVLYQDDKKDKYRLTELVDISFGMPMQPTESVDSDHWYGALYYKIIPFKKGSRTMYTLLGWDHHSTLSQVKLIDVMYFTSSQVKFGSPVFKINSKTQYRVFYEHSKKTNMYLNYEEGRERIMMDHLSPEAPALKEFRSYYVPDMSYDAFVFEKNKWMLVEDVIGVNDGHNHQEERNVHTLNPETGKLETVEIDNKWENPQDLEAPAGGASHVAVTPESLNEEVDSKKGTKKAKRVKNKDKRDPNDLSGILGEKKRKRRKR